MHFVLAVLALFSVASWGAKTVETPAFALESLSDGKPFSLTLNESEKYKATVVVFLSAECPCSQSHEPVLKELSAAYPEMRFIGVVANADEDLKESKAHFAEAALPFPVVYDRGQKLADKLKAYKTPHAFVLTKDFDEPLFRGGVDNSHEAPTATQHFLKNALAAVKLGKTPETREVRVLGCAISR